MLLVDRVEHIKIIAFLCFKYEYEEALVERYREIFVKSFKKQIDDGLFPFIIVDCINDKTRHYEEMWSYAKQKGFEVNSSDILLLIHLETSRIY